MDVRTYLAAIRKGWWITAICCLLGLGGGAYVAYSATPVYEAQLTFYVPPQLSPATNAQSASEFAQQQAISYAEIVSSERLGLMIARATKLDLTPTEIASEIAGTAPLNTVLVDVSVKDSSRARALEIARAAASEFPKMVDQLDSSGRSTAGQAATKVRLAVTSGPRAGTAPISPRKKLDLAVGLAGGLIVGVLLALLRHVLDTSIRTVEQLEEATGIPVIGTIDHDPRAKVNPLVIGAAARTPRAEAMRRLRTNLQFLHAANRLHTLVVTSSVAAEGKSTIAANLAILAAESGRSVALVEADLRRPRAADLLGLDGYVGLTSVLAGLATVDEALQPWGDHGLNVLASGPLPPNPSELLGGAGMRELLRALTERFDLIVIDTPPLSPVSDAAALAAEVDGVAVVFRARKTRRTELCTTVRALQAVDARVVGAVLNMRKAGRQLRRAYEAYETFEAAPAGGTPSDGGTADPAVEAEKPKKRHATSAAGAVETPERAEPASGSNGAAVTQRAGGGDRGGRASSGNSPKR